ncbi:MAG: 50S ribosomal protein L15 [Spirochaetales bacterium]|nr:50S ribosomal protein L15 [Spirochaetales bacterium]
MEQFNIRKPKGATRRKKVVGRGAGSGRGSTATRGSKGQNSRSGGSSRIGFEGGQMPLYRRIARRGFSNYPFKTEYTTVDVKALEVFSDGDTVNKEALVDRKIIRRRAGLIKILGNGALSRKLVVDVDKVTAGARKAIEAAGGTVAGAAAASGRPAARPPAGQVQAGQKEPGGQGPAANKPEPEAPAADTTPKE